MTLHYIRFGAETIEFDFPEPIRETKELTIENVTIQVLPQGCSYLVKSWDTGELTNIFEVERARIE